MYIDRFDCVSIGLSTWLEPKPVLTLLIRMGIGTHSKNSIAFIFFINSQSLEKNSFNFYYPMTYIYILPTEHIDVDNSSMD